jgi:hypothetical protein
MSIIQGHNGTVRNCVFSGTRGTPPQAGLDLESNKNDPLGSIDTITIENSQFEGNAGYGLQISSIASPTNIFVSGCTFKDNGRGPILWVGHNGTISNSKFVN